MEIIKKILKFLYYRFLYKNPIHSDFDINIDLKSTFGKQCILKKNSRVSKSALGDNVLLDTGAIFKEVIAEDHISVYGNTTISFCSIGRYSYFAKNSSIINATIGRFCSVGFGVQIGTGRHPVNFMSTSPVFYSLNRLFTGKPLTTEQHYIEYEDCIIGNDVWIGARSIILDGVKIGDGAIIGANSVVTKDVAPYSIVGGVPAKFIRYRFSEEKIKEIQTLQWWNWPVEKIKQSVHLFQKEIE